MALVTAVALGFVVWFGADSLARMFTDDAAVIGELVPFMLVLAVTQPFLQLHFTLGGAHRGAGACFFAMVLKTDIMWVWYALIFDHVARSIHLAWSFRRGRWKDALGATPSR